MLKRSEHQEQVATVSWFKLQYPKFKKHLFAIPNGAHLAGDPKVRAIKMNKMKAEGLLTGVSDLFMMVPMGGWHGLFIEMKSKGGVVSDDQAEFQGAAHLIGYFCAVCYSFEEAKNVISDYLESKI